MFARRNFVHKRSHNGARFNLAALPDSTPVLTPINAPSASSSDPQKTDPLTSVPTVTPDPPTSKTTDTPTTSPSPSSSSPTLNAPTTTPTSSPSPSSTSAASSVVSTSSHTPATSSTASTPLVVPSSTTPHALSSLLPATTQVSISFTPASTLAPSATSSAGSSGGTNTGVIIGGVAGTLAGVAALGFLLMWCMRRQRNRDIDDFDAQAFKRQSAILVDDPVEQPRSYNPRPPTMIERHNVSPALAAQTGYGGQNFYGSYGGYGDQPTYPPEMAQPSGPLPQQAYAAPSTGYAGYDDPRQQIARQPSNVGYADYDSRQQLGSQPSNAQYLTRQPSSAVGYAPSAAPPSSLNQNAHYIDLNRSSVTPYQAAQYADISRHLGTTDPNEQTVHQPSDSELPDGPLPSPFDDPVEPDVVPITTSHVHPVTTNPAQPHGNAPLFHQRPTTVYEEGDAYSGI